MQWSSALDASLDKERDETCVEHHVVNDFILHCHSDNTVHYNTSVLIEPFIDSIQRFF